MTFWRSFKPVADPARTAYAVGTPKAGSPHWRDILYDTEVLAGVTGAAVATRFRGGLGQSGALGASALLPEPPEGRTDGCPVATPVAGGVGIACAVNAGGGAGAAP